MAARRKGGRVAPNVRKQDNAGQSMSRARSAALVLLCLLGACLNPRPEELPSSTYDPDSPSSDDRLGAPEANAEQAPEPTGAPGEESSEDITTLQAPEPPPALDAPPGDGGVPVDVESDAGVVEATPDAG